MGWEEQEGSQAVVLSLAVMRPKGGAGRAQESTPSHAWLYSHVIKEVAGVDSDAETLCACALCA